MTSLDTLDRLDSCEPARYPVGLDRFAVRGPVGSAGPAAAFPAGCEAAQRPLEPAAGAGDGHRGGPGGPRSLSLVSPGPSRATFWRRRLVVLVGLVLLGLLLTGVIGQVGASADLADRVDGHVVVEPGQTLWDIAVLTAPDGMDARSQLAAIEELNRVRADDVAAWNVILLPAR